MKRLAAHIMHYNKALVAALIIGANALRSRYGIDFGLDHQLAGEVLSALTVYAVYQVPNGSHPDSLDA